VPQRVWPTIRSVGISVTTHSGSGLRRNLRWSVSGFCMVPSIPDRETDVELVVNDAGAALAVTMKCGRAPTSSKRAKDTFTIQGICDLLGRDAFGIVGEIPFIRSGFSGNYGSVAFYGVTSFGILYEVFITAAQVSDYTGTAALMNGRPKAEWFLADRGYDADWFGEIFLDKGTQPSTLGR